MGFNLDLYKDLRSRVDTQLVAHGGAGPFSNIADLFIKTNVENELNWKLMKWKIEVALNSIE